MDDELMWVADCVVASTPNSAITIPDTANEFAIKGNHLTLVKGNQFDGRIKTDLHKLIHEFLRILVSNKHKLEQISAAFLSDESSALIQNKVPSKLEDPESFIIPCNFEKAFSCDALADLGLVIIKTKEDSKVPLILGIDVIDKILEEDFDALLDEVVQKQRRLNPNMQQVVKKEIVKLLDSGIIYPIAYSPWVSHIYCVPKKGGITMVTNEKDELVPTRTVTGWRVCIDYCKLNEATSKDHFPLPFMDQMLERLTGNKYFCFLDGFSGYFQISIDPMDQEKTTFTCPFGIYAYRRMPVGLCNALDTFQRCILAIFHDMIEEFVKVFMDDFFIFGNSFDNYLNNLDKMLQRCKDASCLNNLSKMLQRCKDTHLVFNWKTSLHG
nr:reverse transcriptase domain-containing protein [Tanacetum cinerariifolium]